MRLRETLWASRMTGSAALVAQIALIALMALVALALPSVPAHADTPPAGQLPLSYVTAPAAYPWTGRLRAIAFRPQPADRAIAAGTDAWEAGALLRRRQPSTRALFTSLAAGDGQPERLVPLSWPALDAASRAWLDANPRGQTSDGRARLGWLRGDLSVDGDADLRPRDTPLANAAGARVLVVPPPLWHPGQPGHAAFRERYRGRPTTVWLGTADTVLHGFDAITGTELAGYLPRTTLRQAGAASTRVARMAHAPCPRPESVDASLAGVWSTLLLCGVGRPRIDDDTANGEREAAGVFVLDVSNVVGPLPIRLVWEVAASRELPLAPAGPVRAALLDDGGQARWYAIVPTMGAPDVPADAPAAASLALLPLDKPPAAGWSGRYAIRRVPLPASGCDDATPAPLVALSIGTQANGMATAAYAADARGRLWRVGLDHALTQGPPPQLACLYHLSAPTRADMAEAPALLAIPGGTLVVYGAGNRIAAVPDTGADRPAAPRRIRAEKVGDGFVLGGDAADANAGGFDGWIVQLPRPGETLDHFLADATGYLGFVTGTPDGNLHAYLVHALSGESRLADTPGAAPTPMITGRPAGRAGEAVIELVRLPLPAAAPPAVGAGTHETHETQDVSLWALDGTHARQLARTTASRRTGRLGWRELIDPEAP